MKYLFVLTALFFSVAFFSTQTQAADKSTLQRHANNYFSEVQLQRYLKKTTNHNAVTYPILRQLKLQDANCNDNPVTSPKSCIETVCSKVSKYDCDEASEIQQIAGFCKHNVDGDCIDAVCNKISKFDCDDISEVKQIAGMCSGHFSSKCFDTTCTYLSKFECDDLSEAKDIMTNVCTPDVDPDCIKTVCSKLSKFECDDLSELKVIAKSCSTN